MTKIEEAGFKIKTKKEMVLTEDIIRQMYKEDKPYYEDLREYLMTYVSCLLS